MQSSYVGRIFGDDVCGVNVLQKTWVYAFCGRVGLGCVGLCWVMVVANRSDCFRYSHRSLFSNTYRYMDF